MRVYTVIIQKRRESGALLYSVIGGIFKNKENAMQYVNIRMEDEAHFLDETHTTTRQSDGYWETTLRGYSFDGLIEYVFIIKKHVVR